MVRKRRRPLKLAVITDLHHGLAPDALHRLEVFCTAVKQRKGLDAVVQMGDMCYFEQTSQPCLSLFHDLNHPKIQVLGNHDMDKCDKQTAVAQLRMGHRFGTVDLGDYRMVMLDLNHFKKGGNLVAYSHGNYFTDNATHNWADQEQLSWLKLELRRGTKPTLLFSHQPLGFAEPGQELPPEQVEVLKVISDAKMENPDGAVAACFFGHLHVDRLEFYEGIPCYCVNSASYFWGGGMFAYDKPLFAFLEVNENGELSVEGQLGGFVKVPPASTDGVLGRSASIQNRRLSLLAAK